MRRAAQERSAADHAAGPARDAHLELEKRYRELVVGSTAAETSETASAI